VNDTNGHASKGDLSLITLHLARCPRFPEGSPSKGYRFIAPLDADGRIDPALWHDRRQRCLVNRFWDDQPTKSGHLVHRAGGAGGATWCFNYPDAGTDDVGKHLDDHRFLPGEYVSIKEDHGDWATFQVSDVRPVAHAKQNPTVVSPMPGRHS
jgi:hypothetical protein